MAKQINDRVYFVDEIDVNKLSFSVPKKLGQKGAQIMYANYREDDGKVYRLHVQTPRMRCPFGLSPWAEEGQKEQWSISCSFYCPEPNARVEKFFKLCEAIDNKALDALWENREQLRLRAKSKDSLADGFIYGSLRYPKNQDPNKPISPSFRSRCKKNDNDEFIDLEVYDGETRQLKEPSYLEPRNHIVKISRLTGVYVVGPTNYGLSWDASRVKVYRSKRLGKGVEVFRADEEDEEPIIEDDEAGLEKPNNGVVDANDSGSDSDSDDGGSYQGDDGTQSA